MISILFLAADPSDASRLHLGEEFREMQEKLQLAKLRDEFVLHQRMSVRPEDISQALLDIEPSIVHFSGPGRAEGTLCFEDRQGKVQPIQTDALAALFAQFKDKVKCVILNACYSEPQAKAVAKHIEFVIGMHQAIGAKAAIAFTLGFYQALGANRQFEEAYQLGCIQIRLQGIPEYLTPILLKKTKSLEERKRNLREKADCLINKDKKKDALSNYFFYVSLDKIEKIESGQALPKKSLDETINTTLQETSTQVGRFNDYRLRCQRLHDLLRQLGTAQQIQNLSTQGNPPHIATGWTYAEIKLRVTQRTGDILILAGTINNYTVLLSCSQQNFFDFDPNKGKISYTSTNHWFIDGTAEYLFRSHFWILSVDEDNLQIMGSPVYLSLPVGILSN